jgi:hypothetical protein
VQVRADKVDGHKRHVTAISLKEGVLEEIKARHEIGSDAELAREIGISAPMLSQVKSGHRGVGPMFMLGMLEAFGYGFHLGEDCIYDVTVDGVHCELEGP